MIRTISRDDQSGYYNGIQIASMLIFTESLQLFSDIGIYSIPSSSVNYRKLSRIIGVSGFVFGLASLIAGASISVIAFILRHW